MKNRKIIAFTMALLLIFACVPVKYTANAQTLSTMTFKELKSIFNRALTSISNMDVNDREDMISIFKMGIVTDKGISNLIDLLMGDGDTVTTYRDRLYAKYPDITSAKYEKALGLMHLFKIFTPDERVAMIDNIANGTMPDALPFAEAQEITEKIKSTFPDLEGVIQETEPKFQLDMYLFILQFLQGKIDHPIVTDAPNQPGKIVVETVSKIGDVEVETIINQAIGNLEINGHSFTTYRQMSQLFVDQINNRFSTAQMNSLKSVFAYYGFYKGDTQAPVISIAEEVVTITVGTDFDLREGVTAADDLDGAITNIDVVTGTFDKNTPGTYTITYKAKDAAGNIGEATRTIIVIKIETVEQESEDGTTEATVTVEGIEPDNTGMTKEAKVEVPVSPKVKAELGIKADQEITITLPPLAMNSGDKVEIKIKKATQADSISRPKDKVLAIEITIKQLGSKKVKLVLPIPQNLPQNQAGAFHGVAKNGKMRWEFRAANVVDGQLVFETNLSPVVIAEKVAVPTITETTKTTNAVTLNWTSSVENPSFEVYKDNSLVGTTTEKTYVVTGLSSNTIYNFKVKAIDADGFESDFSAETAVTTSSSSSSGGGGGGFISNSKTIQASAGGDFSKYDATVELPKNAFDFADKIKITIDRVSKTDKLPMAENMKLISRVIEITKDEEGEFKKPVKITLEYDKSKVDLEKYDVSIFWLDEEEDKWVELDNVKLDVKDAEVSGEVTHFTKFAVLATEKEVVPVEPVVELTDIAGHWAEDSIKELVTMGAISGYPDKTFKPDNKITRAEFATVLVKAFNLEAKSGKIFVDTANHWAKGDIATAQAYGIVSGYNDTTFGPNDLITREQMAVMVIKAAGLDQVTGEIDFTDKDQISNWAVDAIGAAAAKEIIGGYEDKTFKPKNNATRAEAVTVIINALN
ncbi:S-layer homology domain-containing protein [Clostridiaceae bacterium 35-E11]